MKHFFYQIQDPYISKKIEVNLKECKTVKDLKKKISFDLHIFDYNLIIDKPPLDKELSKIPDYSSFKIRFDYQRCKDIDFDLPNGKLIHIKDCYKKHFPDIINSFREKKIYYSEDCIKNIHFIVNKQEVPHIEYPLLAVPFGVHVLIKMSCQVTAITYGYNQFIFSTNETVITAEKVIRKQYEGCSSVSILNELNHKLNPDDKFRYYSKYSLFIDYEITFQHLSSSARSIQHLDFLATVYDAKRQLAIVYSNNGQLVPENIILYDYMKLPINDTRKTLKSIQDLKKHFYFDIDNKKKFHNISTKRHQNNEIIYGYDPTLDRIKRNTSLSHSFQKDNYSKQEFSHAKPHSMSPDYFLKHKKQQFPDSDSRVYPKSPDRNSLRPKDPNRQSFKKIDNNHSQKSKTLHQNEIKDPIRKPRDYYYGDNKGNTYNYDSKRNQNDQPIKSKLPQNSNKNSNYDIDNDNDDDRSHESTKIVINLNNHDSSSSSDHISPKGTFKPSFQFGSFNVSNSSNKFGSTKRVNVSDDENDDMNSFNKFQNNSPNKTSGDDIANNSIKKLKPNIISDDDDDDVIASNGIKNLKQAQISNDNDDDINFSSNSINNSKQGAINDIAYISDGTKNPKQIQNSDSDDDFGNSSAKNSEHAQISDNGNDSNGTKNSRQGTIINVEEEEEEGDDFSNDLSNNSEHAQIINNYNSSNDTKNSKQITISDDNNEEDHDLVSNSAKNSVQAKIINSDDTDSLNDSASLKHRTSSIQTNDIKSSNRMQTNANDYDNDEEDEEGNFNFNNSNDDDIVYMKSSSSDKGTKESDNDDDDNDDDNESHKSGRFTAELDAEQQSDKLPDLIIEEEEEEFEYSHNNSGNLSSRPKTNKYYFQTNRDSRVSEIDLDSDATVKAMKMSIAEKNGIKNLNNVKILFAGRELLDDLVLEELNIGDTNLFIYIRSEEDIILMSAKALQFDNNQPQSFEEEDFE